MRLAAAVIFLQQLIESVNFHAVDPDMVHPGLRDGRRAEGDFRSFVLHVDVFEGEIVESVFVRRLDLKEIAAMHPDGAQGDVGADGHGHILPVPEVVELRPWIAGDPVAAAARDALHGHVLITLGRVRTHLEPEQVVGVLYMAAPQDDVAIVHGLAAQGQAAVGLPERAVLDNDVAVGLIGNVL